MEKLYSILKGIFKGILKLILWVILCFVLTQIFIIIAIIQNGGHPVHGSTYSFLATTIMIIIMCICNYRKAKKKNKME